MVVWATVRNVIAETLTGCTDKSTRISCCHSPTETVFAQSECDQSRAASVVTLMIRLLNQTTLANGDEILNRFADESFRKHSRPPRTRERANIIDGFRDRHAATAVRWKLRPLSLYENCERVQREQPDQTINRKTPIPLGSGSAHWSSWFQIPNFES